MKITIDKTITDITPQFSMGVLVAKVSTFKNKELDHQIDDLEQVINDSIDITDVVNLPIIKDGRDAYKAYGKDPSRYRLATESLYRRLSKGNKLYRINNVVDTGNVLSIQTRKSVAVLNYDKIVGDVIIRLGKDTDEYYGIGRGKLNITNIPLYEDNIGPFGSVTSDTERTMITNDTKQILLFIISFSGKEDLKVDLERAVNLYSTYCGATIIEKYIL